jgi:hypothetical protein
VLAVAVAALTPLLALPSSAGANDAPVVTNTTITPSALTYVGGNVTITANVTDDSNALDIVFIEVRGPYWWSVAMTQGPDPFQWSGTVELPPNFTPDPIGWQFEVRALDLEEAETSVAAGHVLVDGQPPFDQPPSVYDPAVTPRNLPSTGGPVTLAVSASDTRGISEAYAVVNGPGGATTHVVLQPISADRFTGVFNAPANPGTSAMQYSVVMTALDDIGQAGTADGGLITVAGRPTGRLEIKPGTLDFGATQVGKRNQRSVVLRNVGARSTVPVEGLIQTSGAPYVVVGAPATGLPFCLRAGETMTIRVEFRPTAVGVRKGTLRVSRPDRVQPTLSVPLSGAGIARWHAAAPTFGAAPATKTCARR